ncbi:hypothetical protein FOQG_03548 [Fusarium oxysporum f. sp. raphani 54005]|uniref:BTB domain-containing protein n=4 Tax=Fusarium oxysporum TaxID=5507 RepID=X0D097_FUSOX|nr:hypothetical protein FOVG_00185 [Fusarium oxysporum f. sp. pisi HDV247]EXK96544.1 hypothetical protein FOQG_03548 [Fusarium oxysporum f. sp. raphani 54005]KAG7438382.1 hypothetical protein Forpi1262_v000327 [Fusarium oxysporum f. sp. raphani]KAH7208055.1 hypothetical protein BKA60DRAFT_524920 [Fusarium oxysporum]WKT39902.1 hypothetical protein QSH57_001721 [Fusarium oxysporum f. sp. vasinfectum]
MKSVSYVIDPDGDIELVLNEPNAQNIIPERVLCGDGDAANDSPTTDFNNSVLQGRYAVFDNFDTPTFVDDYGDLDFVEETPDVVRIRVSSKHLTFASKIFSAMLQGPWSEASSFPSRGSPRQVATSDWDAKALAIVLDAIHGRFRQIPKYINLVLLARIATIVDYYQCYESMELISTLWLSQQSVTQENSDLYTESSLLRLYVAWVFESDVLFTAVARRVLRYSKGLSEFDLKELPVGGVFDVLNDKRTELIRRVLEGLDILQETLRTEEECPGLGLSDCSSMLLGTLMRERFRWEDELTPLEPPYDGYSVVTMRALVDGFPRPKPLQPNYDNSGRSSSGELDVYHRRCMCTIQGRIQKLMKGINNDIKGFRPSRIQGWGLRQKEND